MKIHGVMIGILMLFMAFFVGDASAKGEHDHDARFGGVVHEAGGLVFELVGKGESLDLYVTDHGKAVSLSGATADLTLLAGSEKSQVNLRAAGEDKFSVSGVKGIVAGAKLAGIVSMTGQKPIAVKFTIK